MSATPVVIPRPKLLFLWLLDCMLAFQAPNYSSHYYTNSLTLCRLDQQTAASSKSLQEGFDSFAHVSLHFFNSKLLFLPGSTVIVSVLMFLLLLLCFHPCFYLSLLIISDLRLLSHCAQYLYFLCMECFKCSIKLFLWLWCYYVTTILIISLSSRRRRRTAAMILKNAALSSVIPCYGIKTLQCVGCTFFLLAIPFVILNQNSILSSEKSRPRYLPSRLKQAENT